MILSATVSLPFVIVAVDSSLLPHDSQLAVSLRPANEIKESTCAVSRALLPAASGAVDETQPEKARCVVLWCPDVPGDYTVILADANEENIISTVHLHVQQRDLSGAGGGGLPSGSIFVHAQKVECGGEIIVTAYDANACFGGSWVLCEADAPAVGSVPALHGWFAPSNSFTPSSSSSGWRSRAFDYAALEHAAQFSLPAPTLIGLYEVRYLKTTGDATAAPAVVARSAPFEVVFNEDLVTRSPTGSMTVMEDLTETDIGGRITPMQRLFVYVDLSGVNPLEVTRDDFIRFVPFGGLSERELPCVVAIRSGVLRGAFAVAAPAHPARYEMQYCSGFSSSVLAAVNVEVKAADNVTLSLVTCDQETMEFVAPPGSSVLHTAWIISTASSNNNTNRVDLRLVSTGCAVIAEDERGLILGSFALSRAQISADEEAMACFVDDVALMHMMRMNVAVFSLLDTRLGSVVARCACNLEFLESEAMAPRTSEILRLVAPRCRFGPFKPDETFPQLCDSSFYLCVETASLARDGPRIIFAVAEENEASVGLRSDLGDPLFEAGISPPLVWSGGVQAFHQLPRQAAEAPVVFLDFSRKLLRSSTVLRVFLVENGTDCLLLDQQKIFFEAPAAPPLVLESPFSRKVRALLVDAYRDRKAARAGCVEQLRTFLRSGWDVLQLEVLEPPPPQQVDHCGTMSHRQGLIAAAVQRSAPLHGTLVGRLRSMMSACAEDETVVVLLCTDGGLLSLPPTGVAADDVDQVVRKHLFPWDYDARFATITPASIAALVAVSGCRGQVVVVADTVIMHHPRQSIKEKDDISPLNRKKTPLLGGEVLGGECGLGNAVTADSLAAVNHRAMLHDGYELMPIDAPASDRCRCSRRTNSSHHQLIWLERTQIKLSSPLMALQQGPPPPGSIVDPLISGLSRCVAGHTWGEACSVIQMQAAALGGPFRVQCWHRRVDWSSEQEACM